MENQRNGIIEAIDYRLKTLQREIDDQAPRNIPGTTQLTLRIENDLKARLDVVASFLMTSRNSIINEFLEVAVEEAFVRICENPYFENLKVDGKTIQEAMVAALRGEYQERSKINDLVSDVESGKITPEALAKGLK